LASSSEILSLTRTSQDQCGKYMSLVFATYTLHSQVFRISFKPVHILPLTFLLKDFILYWAREVFKLSCSVRL